MTSEREELVALLESLDDADDAVVLASARAIAQLAERLDLDWTAVLTVPETAAAQPLLPEGSDLAAVITVLLAHREVTDETKVDLGEFAAQLTQGTLDPEDRKYIEALAARLGVL